MSYSYRSSKPPGARRRSNFAGGGSSRPVRSGGNRRQGQYIDPARFVRAAKPVVAAEYTPRNASFNDFAVDDLLLRNIAVKGYTVPSPIQDETIPLGLAGKDVIGIAGTGTGKTAAFALPVLHQLLTARSGRALIVAPTRELAQQIDKEFASIARGSGLRGAVLIGGANIQPQLRALRDQPNVVIGTPGRIKDHLERRSLDLSSFNFVVLDEVDRMLDMGFVNDVRTILSQLAPQRQSFFFSATLDRRVSDLIQTFANNPVTISLQTGEASENVHQDVVLYGGSSEKLDKLHNVLLDGAASKVIVFDETQRGVERLSKELVARGFKADSIHGGKSQGQRQRALQRFKQNEVTILVATDVAARGLDVTDISHVVNYSLPMSYDDYIHRIGRAGRAGRTGYALTFVAQ
jgi:superfamily II DNA/RNA helicase